MDLLTQQMQTAIAKTLLAGGESLLNEQGIDENVCTQIAQQIMAELSKLPIHVLVAVRGGCIQGALADLANVHLEIHDFDVFESEARDDEGRTADRAEKEWDEAQSRLHPIY